MKKSTFLLGCLCFATFLIMGTTPPAFSQDIVRAKIGIELAFGDISFRAKAVDRIKAGQNFRIYVIPETDSHVYVVHTDHKTVTLLNYSIVSMGSKLVLPSAGNYFQIDGLSKKESLTIICSKNKLSNVHTALSTKNLSHPKWKKLEKTLLSKSKIDLAETSDKPFAIAGNVRGMAGKPKERPAWSLANIPLYSGKSSLVKRFRFNVIP